MILNEFVIGLVFGMFFILLLSAVITIVVMKYNNRHIDEYENLCLDKFHNTNDYLNKSLRYLKLTNCINNKNGGFSTPMVLVILIVLIIMVLTTIYMCSRYI